LEMQREQSAKELAYASANLTIANLRADMEQVKAEAAVNTGDADTSKAIADLQLQLDAALQTLASKKVQVDEAAAKTELATAALASAVAQTPTDGPNPNQNQNSSHAVIVVVAVGLVLIVLIVAFVVVKRNAAANGGIPTTAMMATTAGTYEHGPLSGHASAVATPISYDNPMYASMA